MGYELNALFEIGNMAALIAIYAYIAFEDFTLLKIGNNAVLVLLTIGFAAKIGAGFPTFWSDLATAGLLFGLTFPFWLGRLLGAGDVKLLTVTGFIVGFDGAFELSVLMLGFSLLLIFAISYGRYLLFLPTTFNRRLGEILVDGKVPYGVPIAFATISMLGGRLAAAA